MESGGSVGSKSGSSLPVRIGLLLVVLGTTWAGVAAARSDSWNTACYEANICDGLTFVVVAELLADGVTPYDTQIREDYISNTRFQGAAVPFDLPFQYPPNSLPMFAPRSWLSPQVSHVVFAGLTTLLFLLMTLQLVRQNRVDPLTAALLIGGVAFSTIASFNAHLGQTGALAGGLVVGAVVLWGKSPIGAGLLIGVLTFKPQYAIPMLLVALIRGNWRICAGAVSSFVLFAVWSGIAFGFSQWYGFFRGIGQPNYTAPFMVNWMGPASRLFPGNELILGAALPVFAVAMLFLGALLWTTRDRMELHGQLSIAIVLAVLTSPNTHPYDLLVLAPALAYTATTGAGHFVGVAFLLVTSSFISPPQRWALTLAITLFAGACIYISRRGVTRVSCG